MRRATHAVFLGLMLSLLAGVMPAQAQSNGLFVGGYGMVGGMNFAAVESFDAVAGTSRGRLLGGGATVGLPWGGLFVDVGGWRVSQEGERVFVSGADVYKLGIPVTITVTPIEITGGWQFRGISRRFVPYVGAGASSYAYKETSSRSAAGEDVDERFSGYHVLGGVEFKVMKWLGVGGEVAWTTIPEALGAGGVSAGFDETDLGGTSFRMRITVGR